MRYREFRPRSELSGVAVCAWERTVPRVGAPATSRVLPDGCVDLVWRAGRVVCSGPGPGTGDEPAAARRDDHRPAHAPRGRGQALGLPASELRDGRVALDSLWGRPGAELAERVAEAASPQDRRRVLEEALLARMHSMERPDELVLAATRRLGLPGCRVGALSEVLGTSERQLLRRFNAAVGYGPKTLDRVLRFRRFLSLAPAVASGEEALARIAAELGYADQAHLTRECVRLSGLTPGRLLLSA